MDRRRFLRVGTGALGAGLIGSAVPGAPRLFAQVPAAPDTSATPASGPPDIVVAKGSPEDAVRQALDALGGIGRFVRPGQVVVVKPNAGFASPPEWGATTHPGVLTAVAAACLQAGARRLFVVDHTLAPSDRCFDRTGIGAAVASIPGAKLVALDDPKAYRAVEIPRGKALKRTDIAEVALKADVLINIPTAKAHTATGVSFGLKNLMGLVWDRQVFHTDMDIHVGIADLATVLRPALTIVDAMVVLTTRGPAGPGDVANFGGVVAGVDPVAVDAYAVGLATWNQQTLAPGQIGFLRHAAERGVGTLDLSSLRIVRPA
jgi:uncharacterized protein (DUF362 family)